MRILFLTDNFFPEVNAAASRVYERAVYWASWGHEVCVLTSAPNFPDGKVYPGYQNKWYQKEIIHGVEVIRVKTFIAPNKGFKLRILDFLSYMLMAILIGVGLRKPDVIIANSPQPFTAVAGLFLGKLKRCPFIFELADLWPATMKDVIHVNKKFIQFAEHCELFLYRKSTAIIALTDSFKTDLINRKIPAKKIFVVKNGTNLHFFQPEIKDHQLCTLLSLDNSFVIGYIGTLGMAHGLENILLTAKLLKNTSIKVLFVGSGAEKEKLVQLASNLAVDNVVFLPLQPKSAIKKYWGLCDAAFVHLKNKPIFQTVIPSKIFEAMAMELPIIFVGPNGEASEIIDKTGAGVCVQPENPSALARALIDLSKDNKKLAQYKKACKESVGEFTREKQAKEFLNVLKAVVD